MNRWWRVCICLFMLISADEAAAQPPSYKDELAKLQGKWKCIGGNLAGEKLSEAEAAAKEMTFEFKEDKLHCFVKGQEKKVYSFTIEPLRSPREIDTVQLNGAQKGQRGRGIYAIEGDTLKICLRDKLNGRPGKFDVPEGVDDIYLILEHELPMTFRTSFATRLLGYSISPVIRAAIVDGRKK